MTKKIETSNNAVVSKKANNNLQEVKIPSFVAVESYVGAIVLLATRSPSHKHLFLNDLEWLVIPAVANKQFKIFRNQKNEPVAFISWANINTDVEKRILQGGAKLSPNEWNSGKNVWIIDIIAPFGAPINALEELLNTDLKEKNAKILNPSEDGKSFIGKSFAQFITEKKSEVKKAS